ncbi:MAG: hypothetical protein ABIP62_15380 [Vicinamibacteria bacterium]
METVGSLSRLFDIGRFAVGMSFAVEEMTPKSRNGAQNLTGA